MLNNIEKTDLFYQYYSYGILRINIPIAHRLPKIIASVVCPATKSLKFFHRQLPHECPARQNMLESIHGQFG